MRAITQNLRLLGTLAVLGSMSVSGALAGPPEGAAGAPNFMPALYGDDEMWGTKGTTEIPAPNASNEQSFDALFVFTNGAMGQLPVAEAAPGNPYYDGGRWAVYTATWLIGEPPILTSYDDIAYHVGEEDLMVGLGSPDGGPPPYFQCPMLPILYDD